MIEQRSADWFAQRTGKITGSRVGAILGLSPFAKPADVLRSMVREQCGAESEFKGNVATEYGTFHEEYAQADFEHDLGVKVDEVGFLEHPELNWLGASPDGLVGDVSVIEIKCPYGKRDDKFPIFKTMKEQPHYYAQIQIEMFCAQREQCYFFQWNKHGSTVEIVKFNQAWIDEALPKLEAFYKLFLSELENPEHLEPLVVEISNQTAADEYRLAKSDLEKAKEKLETAKAQLIEMADGRKANISGLSVYKVKKQGAVSYAKVVKEHCADVDLEPYRGKPSEFWGVK